MSHWTITTLTILELSETDPWHPVSPLKGRRSVDRKQILIEIEMVSGSVTTTMSVSGTGWCFYLISTTVLQGRSITIEQKDK